LARERQARHRADDAAERGGLQRRRVREGGLLEHHAHGVPGGGEQAQQHARRGGRPGSRRTGRTAAVADERDHQADHEPDPEAFLEHDAREDPRPGSVPMPMTSAAVPASVCRSPQFSATM